MRGSLRLQLFSALVLLPVIVAAALTTVAIRLFRQDKELYVYDLSAQSVDLVARNLATTLESLRLRAELSPKPQAPFLELRRSSGAAATADALRVERVAADRLRVTAVERSASLVFEVRPEALLDLRGHAGALQLMVVSRDGAVVLHGALARAPKREELRAVVERLRIFTPGAPRVGSRAVALGGPSLVAYARVPGSDVAVLRAIPEREVFAAAQPLITSAALASGVVVLAAILVALVLGAVVIRPLRVMREQAQAIMRGEYGVAFQGAASGDLARLQESLNAMSAALKAREDELWQIQHQLLQAERVNTVARVASGIARELAAPVEGCFTSASQLLEGVPGSSPLRPRLEAVIREASRASQVLQRLVRVERETDRAAQGSLEVALEVVVTETLLTAGPVLERRGISVRTDLGEPLSTTVPSPEQLRSALLDLLLFVAESARERSQVVIRTGRRDGQVTVSVDYRGEVLAPGEQSGLTAMSGQGNGKGGLVLAVASMVLEEQGGKLLVEGTEGGNHLAVLLPALDPAGPVPAAARK